MNAKARLSIAKVNHAHVPLFLHLEIRVQEEFGLSFKLLIQIVCDKFGLWAQVPKSLDCGFGGMAGHCVSAAFTVTASEQ